jgi:hypothetical protein
MAPGPGSERKKAAVAVIASKSLLELEWRTGGEA